MTADRQTGDLGRKLREARERKGVSLREIANATKISVGMLDALERNDIKRLPGGIFSRAFVRSFATEVGLDPEATIQEFIAQFRDDSVTAGHRSSAPIDDNDAIESNRRMATTFLRLILLSVPVAGVIVYFTMAGRRAAVPVSPPATESATASTRSPAAAPAAADVDRAGAPQTPARDESLSPTAPVVNRLVVNFSVSRPCWVTATVDGKKQVERLMQPGDKRTVEVLHNLVLTTGDAGAVAMTINGAEAKPLGKSGEVVTARLDFTNFKTFLLAQ